MKHVKLGVRLESLALPLRRALQEAVRLGVGGVQIDAVGDLTPGKLTQTGRRELMHLHRSHNLQIAAVGCPLRRGLDCAQDQEQRIEHVRKVMSLSFDLGARLVVVGAGHVPAELADPRRQLFKEALLTLAAHGDRTGVVLALETGLELGDVLGPFLTTFDSGGLGVTLDPGNLLMNGFDPYQSVQALRGLVKHVHAHDARSATANRSAQEVAVGHGDIDWLQFLSVLEEIDYHGWMIVERESGEQRLADVAAGVTFMRRLVG
jgi:sugar phosphate isomerase/epimerase